MQSASEQEKASGERIARLGPNAIEIPDEDFASAFVVVGSNVYFDQPDSGGDGLVVLGQGGARLLAETLLANLPSPAPMVEQAGEDISRDISGETVCGFRVAAYRETHPEHGAKYGHHYSEHWSTPNTRNPAVTVERLFTEEQLRAALNTRPAPAETEGVPARQQIAEAIAVSVYGVEWKNLTKDSQTALLIGAEAVAALSTPPADAGMLREALQGFVDDLTDEGRNRDTCLSINHDALMVRIKEARAALNSQAHQIREGDHD